MVHSAHTHSRQQAHTHSTGTLIERCLEPGLARFCGGDAASAGVSGPSWMPTGQPVAAHWQGEPEITRSKSIEARDGSLGAAPQRRSWVLQVLLRWRRRLGWVRWAAGYCGSRGKLPTTVATQDAKQLL